MSPVAYMKWADANPVLVAAMREWVGDCEWADVVDDLADWMIVRGVSHHYDGGVRQFVADQA